jgi:type II secretory pathway component PulF
MATYEDSYVEIRRALESVAKGARDRRTAASLRRVRERIIEGDSLYQAFEKEGDRYPAIFLRMTKVGEESGTLALVYNELAAYLEQRYAMRRRFLMQLIYPCFMVAVLILVHSLLTAVWASVTEVGLDLSNIERVFVKTLAKDLAIIGVIVAAVLLVRFLFWGKSITDALLIFIPGLAGPFRKQMLARFSFSLGLMSSSAIPLPEAVSESGIATNNAYASWVLGKASEHLREGEALTPTLAKTRLFPEDFINVVDVAEESGKIAESMQRVSEHYVEDADLSMTRLVSGIAWGIYIAMMIVMAYYIITLYAGYVGQIQSSMS